MSDAEIRNLERLAQQGDPEAATKLAIAQARITNPNEVEETNWVDKECKDTIYLTPEKILAPVRLLLGDFLDPATEPNNPTKAKWFYTEKDNGLGKTWFPLNTWLNPPYGSEIKHWCEKIHNEAVLGTQIVSLLPCGARYSTKYWQNHILVPELEMICFIRGRVKFLRRDGTVAPQNPYDSQICYYPGNTGDIKRFKELFQDLGTCLEVIIDK